MEAHKTKQQHPSPQLVLAPTFLQALDAGIDRRDEVIRLLNEALSEALNEMEIEHREAA